MKVFLSAYWKHLIFINYEVEPSVLQPYLPNGTELDWYNGKCLVSLVGFLFLQTKIKGISFPFHRNFEEFNLRFYVRRKEGNDWKRGVVFIKEIVPRRMITYVAYALYGEQYFYHPMKHEIKETSNELTVNYAFYANKKWNQISVIADKKSEPIQNNTEDEFITEHYWGYTTLKNGNTSEYNVQHPRWRLHPVKDCNVNVDVSFLYGEQWQPYLNAKPSSIFMADGSPVTIFNRKIIK